MAEWLADPANARMISRNAASAMSSAAVMLERRGRASRDRPRARRPRARAASRAAARQGPHRHDGGRSTSGSARRGDSPRVAHRRRQCGADSRAHRAGDAVVDSLGGRRQDLQACARRDPTVARRVERGARPPAAPPIRHVAASLHRAAQHVARVRGQSRRVEGGLPRQRRRPPLLGVALERREGRPRPVRDEPRVEGAGRARERAHRLRRAKRSTIRS